MEKDTIFKQELDGLREHLSMTSKLIKEFKLPSKNGLFQGCFSMASDMRRDFMSRKVELSITGSGN